VRPLVVDTDLSTDDVMALAYVFGLTGYELQAITVEGTGVVHCPAGAEIAARLVAEMGASVPVACGSGTPLGDGHANPEEWRMAADGGYGLRLAAAAAPADGDAVELLTRTLTSSDVPVDVLAIGPVTTIAQALAASPRLADRVNRIVLMGGAVDVPGNATADQQRGSPEWNLWADAVAAQQVFASGIPLVVVPLDATNEVPVTTALYTELAAAHGTGAADLVFELLATNPYLFGAGNYYWDVLAAVTLADPSVLELAELHLRVGTGAPGEVGRVIRDDAAPGIQVAIGANGDKFAQRFLAGLRHGPARVTPFTAAGTLSVTYDGQRCTLGEPPPGPGLYTVDFGWSGVDSAIAILVTLHSGHDWQEAVDYVADLEHQSANPAWADVVPLAAPIAGVRPIIRVPAGTSGIACATVDETFQATAVSLSAPFTLGED
jgi:pyrimidine-specific ribonucleoside hydrolase